MKIALFQMNPVSGDIQGNEEKIRKAQEAANRAGADLLVNVEASVPGYCVSDQLEEIGFLEAQLEAVQRLTRETDRMASVIGFVDFDAKKRNEDGTIRKYNAAATAQHGAIIGVSRKSLLPNYRYFDDKRLYLPSSSREPVSLHFDDFKLGVSICEDAWDDFYDIKPIPELVRKGAQMIVNINASPFYPGKRQVRDQLIRRHVKAANMPFVYVNTVGAGDNGKNIIPFDGQSMVYDAEGDLVALGKQFEEELLFVDFDKPLQPLELPPLEREKEIYEALVMALRDYARKTGFVQAVVPVSGGIDSNVGLAITAEAFGPENVFAYNMPSRFNSETTRSMAQRTAASFGVHYDIIPIQRISDTILDEFEQHAGSVTSSVARENVHARIRGLLMMLDSNNSGRLLISCGNETEIGLGYATLYGDMCGGISVIGDLPKVDVYKIGRYINRRHGREMIPKDAFTIKPSAELSEGQYDPFDYYVVAPIVGEIIEKRRSPSELARLFRQRQLDPSRFVPDNDGRTVYDKHTPESFEGLAYETYKQLKRSVYKRLQGPPIISVSERAFGFDLRETIINGWCGR